MSDSHFPSARDSLTSVLCRTVAVAALGVALVASPIMASARENVIVAAPFEVGGSPMGNYLSALVAGADRDTVAAATFFREALRADPGNPELIERTFVAALSNGDISEAADLATKLVTRDPKNSLGRLVLGIEQFKAKHYAKARSQFGQGGVGQERDVTAILLTAWTYAGQGDEKKALAILDSIKDSNFALFKNYHAALIADLANDVPEATKRFKAAYAADKTILRLVDAYGRFFAAHGDKAAAEAAYNEFDRGSPRHPIVMAALADLKADKPFDQLVRSPSDGAAEVLYGLGAAGGRQGDELAAMVYLRLSLYMQPQNGLATVTLADIFARLKQNEEAIDVYQSVPESSPLRANADIQTGLTLALLGRSDEAVKQLRDIVAEKPTDQDALTTLGNVLRDQKKFADAADIYTKALGLLPTDDKTAWPLLYFRGISYERMKNWPAAEADFQHALKIVPEQPLVLNYLGYSWVDRGVHLDEAFKMLRRAVALRPEDGYIVDSLGWAHFRLGEYDDAVKELERAVALKPSDPTINDHLGDAYWRIGRKLEAHFQWNHARDLKPEPEDLPAILKKIADGLPDEAKPASAEIQPTPPAAPAPAAAPAPQPAAAPAEPKPDDAKPADSKAAEPVAEPRPAEPKQDEAKPEEAKPAEPTAASPPAAQAPAEPTPPAATVPAETKPDESKPPETKPGETKPTETKPDAAQPAAPTAPPAPAPSEPPPANAPTSATPPLAPPPASAPAEKQNGN